ncbi:MAG: bifunctional hydroxymethylpyrimidine kinase/phosphomethylpyrimidine kinase [Bacteroidaceae bacterium]|nr:bifunctional hydroxymethylpyrimidine kinase/phosphomethylpyrimidine kinase [Bacteroidaceae bacterium]
MNVILTITGSDSTGGAGIQADIKTISSLGGNALSVVTTLTIQNTLGIQEFYDIPAEVIERQIDAVADDIVPCVVKIGMIRNVYTLSAITRCIKRYAPQWVLFSPVVSSSHEELLLDDELIHKIQHELIPLCSAIVVRKRDAAHFSASHVIEADDNHGRCNELCSTIAVYLSQGMTLDEAEKKARFILPPEVNTELTGRCLSLYRDFVAMQDTECKNSHDVIYYANALNVSARYLSQVTRKVANQSPKAIIDNTLLTRIKELLRTDKTIQEIAYALEFSSQAHLTNFFKKLTGTTPTNFRKKQ